jgi:curved DNA-binding protein
MEYKDYYKILGVDKTADQKEIKKVYRRLARQYHPDVNPGDKAAESRFKEINEAYEVLSDPEKRQKYNELGQNYQRWQQSGGQPGGFDWGQYAPQGQPAGQWGGTRVEYGDLNDLFGGGGGFSDFFETLFGGMANGGAPRGRGAGSAGAGTGTRAGQASLRGRDLEQEVEVTLEEAFQGAQRLMEIDGRRLEVKIPAGVQTGSRVRVAGEGMPSGRSGQKGDLYLRIKVLPNSTFERRGDDLYCEVTVDLFAALLGGEARVPTMTGTVSLRIPAGTQVGRTFRLAGQGMPKLRAPSERGDLYAKMRVKLPENLSEQERNLVHEWARLRGQGNG